MTSRPKEPRSLHYAADQLFHPYKEDWPVKDMAILQEGALGKGMELIKWRGFDDVVEEGSGTDKFIIPEGTAEITVEPCFRSLEESLSGSVCLKLYAKQLIRDGLNHKMALVRNRWGGWTSGVIRPIAKVDRLLRLDAWRLPLYSLNLNAGEVARLELTRAPEEGGDSLVGDLALISLGVHFHRA